VIVFDKIPFVQFQDFLSTGLKGFRKTVPKESFLMFDFKRVLNQTHIVGSSRLSSLLPRIFQGKGRRINQDLLDYFSKRFKSVALSFDDITTGFKGSDYIVVGVIDYGDSASHDSFDSLLVLRKIR
jgi:hypothetical protein